MRPRQLDESGRLWSPGLKVGVKPGSEYHLTEYFGPVLGLIAVGTLEEAIAIQNQVDYGLTAGLHSLDRAEVKAWIAAVQAGNVYVNRTTVRRCRPRQPFGGWKKSAIGAGARPAAPNYLIGLSDWHPGQPRSWQPRSRPRGRSPTAPRPSGWTTTAWSRAVPGRTPWPGPRNSASRAMSAP